VADQPKPATMSLAGKTDAQIKGEIATVRAFKRAGFGTLVPHKDIMTFNRWVAAGFRPKEGSKSIKIGAFRMFCKAQVRPLTKEDQKAMKDQKSASEARKAKADNVTPMHPAS
jgi:hypothetical protein